MATTTPKHVDEEINLSDLHAQQNSFLPIFRLPPETLENIFIHAACDYEGDNHSDFRVPHWVNVSYVCSHWRNVALNCPTLWTYHFTVSPKWTKEILARSKHALLKIRINHEYSRTISWWSRLVENVLSHVERIQELRLSFPGHVFPIELSLNAPLLQVLDINFESYASKQTLMITDGHSLRLRTLKLAYCSLPWHSAFNLSEVTTLSLCRLSPSSHKNVPEFLTTLSHMQALTSLHVEHSLPSARDLLSSGALGKVTLPCLARLSVHAPLSTVIALLSCVDIPLKTQVRLGIGSESFFINDFAQLPPLLARRFSQASPSVPTIRSLMIRFSNYMRFTLGASERLDCDAHLSVSDPPEKCSVPLLLGFTMMYAISETARIASDTCCAIPSIHVQTLHVTNPPFSRDFWSKTLGHLDGLRYMTLSGGYMPDLLLLADRPGPAGHTFVPGLEKLELHCITFDSSESDEVVSERSLRDALSSREALQLTMTECSTVDNELEF